MSLAQPSSVGRTSPVSVDDVVEAIGERLSHAHPRPRGETSPCLAFASRSPTPKRWVHDTERGHYTQKDEFAENIPEALIDACRVLGWRLVVVYMGHRPQFDADHPSFTDLAPDVVMEVAAADFHVLTSELETDALARNRAHWREISADPAFPEALSYKGVSFADQLDVPLGRTILSSVDIHIRDYACWTAILGHFQPLAVIGGRLDIHTGLLQAAHESGTLSASIKFGVGENMLPTLHIVDGDGAFDAAQSVDLSLVWGERQTDVLDRRLPGHPSAWAAVGRARNDSFGNDRADGGVRLREHLGVGPETEIVVYAANHRTLYGRDPIDTDGMCCLGWGTYTEGLDRLVGMARGRDDCAIVVKPHPSDDVRRIRMHMAGMPEEAKLLAEDEGFHNRDLLAASAACVSTASSMLSEALASECLPINLWLKETNTLYESGRRDLFDEIAITVENLDALEATIVTHLDDPALRARTLANLKTRMSVAFGETDGRNAERAVHAVLHAAVKTRPDLQDALAAIAR